MTKKKGETEADRLERLLTRAHERMDDRECPVVKRPPVRREKGWR